MPLVLGVMVIQLAAVLAVHDPEPDVSIEPPPPSFPNERVGGSTETAPRDTKDTSRSNPMSNAVFMVLSANGTVAASWCAPLASGVVQIALQAGKSQCLSNRGEAF